MAEAEADANGTVFRVPAHRELGGADGRGPGAISGVRRDFAAYTAWANEMAGDCVTRKQTAQFLTTFIPMEPGITDRAAKNVEAARAAVRGILEGRTSEGIGDTAFGLIQAGTEWLDHYRRTRDPESLSAGRLMRPNIAKTRMIDTVREVVPAAREVHILAADDPGTGDHPPRPSCWGSPARLTETLKGDHFMTAPHAAGLRHPPSTPNLTRPGRSTTGPGSAAPLHRPRSPPARRAPRTCPTSRQPCGYPLTGRCAVRPPDRDHLGHRLDPR